MINNENTDRMSLGGKESQSPFPYKSSHITNRIIYLDSPSSQKSGIVLKGNLLKSNFYTSAKPALPTQHFSPLLHSSPLAILSLTSIILASLNLFIEPLIVPDLLNSKIPRHFLTFQEEALRDISNVHSEAFDVSSHNLYVFIGTNDAWLETWSWRAGLSQWRGI